MSIVRMKLSGTLFTAEKTAFTCVTVHRHQSEDSAHLVPAEGTGVTGNLDLILTGEDLGALKAGKTYFLEITED
jgi:hypothetical protein